MSILLIAGQTDVGKRRTDNQDTFICSTLWSESSALLAVIDGVGGYAGGDRAAAVAKASIEQYMAAPNGKPLSMLREAVVFANNQIYNQRQQERQLAQMCCVLTTVVADCQAGKLSFVHVGDTRLYRYRQGVLEKLTHDHSLVGVREDANELTEAEAMQHPRRNEILRDVGSTTHRVDDPDFLESGETDFRAGDLLLLCSDGLTDMITQAQIKAVLNRTLPLDEQLTELIRIANEQGGKDNITVVLARNNGPIDNHSTQSGNAAAVPTVIPESVSSEPDSIPPGKPQPARKNRTGLWSTLGLLVGGAIAALIWYNYQPARQSGLVAVDSVQTVSGASNRSSVVNQTASRLDSLIQTAHRSKNHWLVLPNDTFRLEKPLLLTDSLQSVVGGDRLTIFMPADTSQASVALRIGRSGDVPIRNVVIRGFKTGIEATDKTTLQLSNVFFQKVDVPIHAVIRQDTFRTAVIGISVQNQPDSSKTIRH